MTRIAQTYHGPNLGPSLSDFAVKLLKTDPPKRPRFPGAPSADAIESAAGRRGVPLTTVALDEPEAVALYQRSLVLVRPDGHVAWRAAAAPADAQALIDRVRGAIERE